MKQITLWFALIAFTFTACQQGDAAASKEVKTEIKKIHDEIMPLKEDFDRASLEIDDILDETEDIDNDPNAQMLILLKDKMEHANDEMMTWMNNYEMENNDLEYLENELEKVKTLEDKYLQADTERKELLN